MVAALAGRRPSSRPGIAPVARRGPKTGTDDKGADVEIEIPFMKGFTVFNAEQIDGLPGHFYATVPAANTAINRLERVDTFFANTKASIQHGGNRAFYSPGRDVVQMPELQTFHDGEAYYGTLARRKPERRPRTGLPPGLRPQQIPGIHSRS